MVKEKRRGRHGPYWDAVKFCESERRLRLVGFCVLGIAAGIVGASYAFAQAPVSPPPFTSAQATQGAGLFAANCAVCHGAKLEGGAGPALSGAGFSQLAAAQSLTVRSLFHVVSTTMPMTAPGSLKQNEYEALIAFLLQSNGYQAGTKPLRKDDPALDGAKLGHADAATGTSASHGVYTVAQAAHGKALYSDNCIQCHGGNLTGVEDAPSLAGTDFLKKWGGQPVGAIHAFIDANMPLGNGGALGPAAEADVVAYILQANGFPAGSAPLPSDPHGLSAIILDKPPSPN